MFKMISLKKYELLFCLGSLSLIGPTLADPVRAQAHAGHWPAGAGRLTKQAA
jgi:hypothetical protein